MKKITKAYELIKSQMEFILTHATELGFSVKIEDVFTGIGNIEYGKFKPRNPDEVMKFIISKQLKVIKNKALLDLKELNAFNIAGTLEFNTDKDGASIEELTSISEQEIQVAKRKFLEAHVLIKDGIATIDSILERENTNFTKIKTRFRQNPLKINTVLNSMNSSYEITTDECTQLSQCLENDYTVIIGHPLHTDRYKVTIGNKSKNQLIIELL